MAPPLSPDSGDVPDLGMLTLLNAVLRRRLLVAGCALALALLAGLTGLTAARSYTSDAAFTVESQQKSNLSGIAAQLGVRVPEGNSGQTPEFFVYLVRSRTLLAPVLTAEYDYVRDGRRARGRLIDLLTDADEAPGRRTDLAIAKLRRSIGTGIDKETRVISVGVTMGSPELARQVLDNILAELNRFNSERQKSQAEAARRFTEQQMERAREELARAEDALLQFRQQNRMIGSSPDLAFREERITREVSRRQQLYTSLSQAYDEARIEEVRNVPALTIVEAPKEPTAPNPRGTVKRTAIALVMGGMAGVALALLLELVGAASGTRRDMAELSALWRATLGDLRHPIRALGRGRRARAQVAPPTH